ncbi:hypothetical protein JHD48_08590 [Sulfurimonas sp. SAG-AH-194-I05]|nr:hypothetical protein [Sulfurimonas sp. SAG-AH-194-I05]MDF1875791.1 hypothetical protein [Sulfurimonas sp. SAG-AH-194-I05]
MKTNILHGGETKRVAASTDATVVVKRPTVYLMNLQLSLKSNVLPSLANFNSGIELSRIETNTNISIKATTINMDSVNPLVLEKQEIICLTDYKRMLTETVKEVVKHN